jgi:hypothetical protein
MCSQKLNRMMLPQLSLELIPGLPNELAENVLYQSSLMDLIKWQKVSWKWNNFINTDRKMSNILFRFPRPLRYRIRGEPRVERREQCRLRK